LSFDPSNWSLKFWESTGTPSPKVGVALGVWGLTPSHSPTLSGVYDVIPGLPLGPHPCNPFALVASPKLGLRQYRTSGSPFGVRLSFWRRQRKLLSPKGKGKSFEVSGRDVCVQRAQSYFCRLAPSPRLELLTKVAVESWSCSFCHRCAVDISELLPFFLAWQGIVRSAPTPSPELLTRVVIENWARSFSHRHMISFSKHLLFLSNLSSAPLEWLRAPELDQSSSYSRDERFSVGRRLFRENSIRDLAPVGQIGPLLMSYRRCLELGRWRCRRHRRCESACCFQACRFLDGRNVRPPGFYQQLGGTHSAWDLFALLN